MDEVPPGSDKTRVAGESSPDVQVALDTKAPDSSAPPNRRDVARMLEDSEATVMSPAVMRSDSVAEPVNRGPGRELDAPTLAAIPNISTKGETIVSSTAATIIAGGVDRPRPAERVGNGPNTSAILLEIGTVLGGRYELLELLGQGGMGAVYKADDREVGRVVAVKVIRPEMASNPEILARFKQELLLSSRVTDRNVIRIYDLGEAQGVKFITMEYMEGDNLHRILKDRKKLEVQEAVEIMEQVANGLAAAHREGIIHRDLKPANIMRDRSRRVVVMDFGLARTFSGDGMTQTGMMLGTMEYMSPEQAQGMEVKASSDIFTVGLILYELLAGTTPFYAESAIASLLMRTQRRASPLVDVDQNIPATLSNIVAKCLEKEPVNRYQSADDLVADLRAWQGKSGVRTVSAPAPRREGRARATPWLRIGVAGALVVAIAAGAGWFVMEKRRAAAPVAQGPVSILIGDFANHTGDSVLDNTLEPMLGVAMEGASFINVYSRGDARKFAKKLPDPTEILDEKTSRLVAIGQGVNAVITGDISLRGDQYDISAIALDSRSGNALAKATVTAASKQEILSELPKLAVPLRKALGDTTPDSVQKEKVSGGFTAASLEAVHQDSLGVEQQFAGKFQEAFESFQKAAEMDKHFARAYTGMAAMDLNLGRTADAVSHMKMAMANVDRMTERERYRNQGLYYQALGDWQGCVDQYNQLVARYPADRVGQNNLATCYTHLRDAPKALEAARRAVEITPKGVGQRLNLAFSAVFAGDFVTAEQEARTALEISPTVPQGHLMLAEAKLGQGQIKEAGDSYGQLAKTGAAGASNAADGLADLAAYQGNYSEAMRLLVEAAAVNAAGKMPEKAARKYAMLADLEELQGHHAEALSYMKKALSNSQAMQIQMLAGLFYTETGHLLESGKPAAALAAQKSSEPQAYGKIIKGLESLNLGDAKEAIAQITAANSLFNTWIGHYELGQVYLKSGAFQQADAEFAICLKRRGEAIELFDDNVPTYAYFPPVYFYQGRAREGMKSATAADSCKSYLGIRGQSQDDPLVAQCRKSLGQ